MGTSAASVEASGKHGYIGIGDKCSSVRYKAKVGEKLYILRRANTNSGHLKIVRPVPCAITGTSALL
eukprot:6192366-Pleurochrysis_carterae.AAC.2